jgi:bifunctional DNA-binding transcriptional regulator/antitoxin component of YhaV-PrlF toxin-antitoxin module
MTKRINVNERETSSLPKEMRQRLGLKETGQVVVVEIYTDKRIAEFNRINEEALRCYRFETKR